MTETEKIIKNSFIIGMEEAVKEVIKGKRSVYVVDEQIINKALSKEKELNVDIVMDILKDMNLKIPNENGIFAVKKRMGDPWE